MGCWLCSCQHLLLQGLPLVLARYTELQPPPSPRSHPPFLFAAPCCRHCVHQAAPGRCRRLCGLPLQAGKWGAGCGEEWLHSRGPGCGRSGAKATAAAAAAAGPAAPLCFLPLPLPHLAHLKLFLLPAWGCLPSSCPPRAGVCGGLWRCPRGAGHGGHLAHPSLHPCASRLHAVSKAVSKVAQMEARAPTTSAAAVRGCCGSAAAAADCLIAPVLHCLPR